MGGTVYQDAPQVRPCRLFLDVLSRKVLVDSTPHPNFSLTVVHLSETKTLGLCTEPRVCSTLLQDRERHGCRARAHMDVLVASPEERYCATAGPN